MVVEDRRRRLLVEPVQRAIASRHRQKDHRHLASLPNLNLFPGLCLRRRRDAIPSTAWTMNASCTWTICSMRMGPIAAARSKRIITPSPPLAYGRHRATNGVARARWVKTRKCRPVHTALELVRAVGPVPVLDGQKEEHHNTHVISKGSSSTRPMPVDRHHPSS